MLINRISWMRINRNLLFSLKYIYIWLNERDWGINNEYVISVVIRKLNVN